MRLAIMQPYLFPYLGHFSLIAACDEWIVFDVSQYTPRSWMNRNRLRKPGGGWVWATVPLSNGSIHIRTSEACVLDADAARARILGQLSHCREAPFLGAVRVIVEETVGGADGSLVRMNVRGLEAVCRYLGLPFRHRICSELALGLPSDLGPGEWAPAICSRLGASAYVNPIGGRALFDPTSFAERRVGLGFVAAQPFRYTAGRWGAQDDLSILDVLLWNDPQRVLSAIRRYELLDHAGGLWPSVRHAGEAADRRGAGVPTAER